MTNEIQPFTENERVAIYWEDCKSLQGIEGSKPRILIARAFRVKEDDTPTNPFRNVNDTIDYLISCRDTWELLPEEFPDFKTKRTEIPNYEISRDTNPLYMHSHTQPSQLVDESIIERCKNKARIPFRNFELNLHRNIDSVVIENIPQSFLLPISEYACLEQFCEFNIGPSIRKGFMGENCEIVHGVKNNEFLESKNEYEAEKILTGLKPNIKNKINLWEGLNLFYPDFRDRMNRIAEFQENWFPGETIRARKGYDDLRKYLSSLKGEGE